jgi:hypothetical protein
MSSDYQLKLAPGTLANASPKPAATPRHALQPGGRYQTAGGVLSRSSASSGAPRLRSRYPFRPTRWAPIALVRCSSGADSADRYNYALWEPSDPVRGTGFYSYTL